MKNRIMLMAALAALVLLGGGARAAERPDSWVTTKVKASLATHQDVSAIHTKVETNKGIVTLRGKARTLAEKELVESYVRGIEGVQGVHNRIVVMSGQTGKSRVSESIDDASITMHVKAALAGDRATSALRTEVDTKDGVVTLSGTAASGAEKTLAERRAMGVKGVKSVDNRIEVK
jgi:hyperosmotically inducible protein